LIKYFFLAKSFLIDSLDIQGKIQFTNDTTYWQANSFKFYFPECNQLLAIRWGRRGNLCGSSCQRLTTNVNKIQGGGTIDGNGQVWYNLYAKNIYTLRPVLMGINGLHDSTISNLILRYSPQYYHFVVNSTNVIFDNINIAGGSVSKNPAKNTDGWDTYRSSDLTIQNSVVNNGDGELNDSSNLRPLILTIARLHCFQA
jgi:galacturan 1,4-alpha-galacturonidase